MEPERTVYKDGDQLWCCRDPTRPQDRLPE